MPSLTALQPKVAPRHSLPNVTVVYRNPFIIRSCVDRRVLHLGCAGWPFTKQRFETGHLLQQQLEEVCDVLAGIDISEDGISFLRSHGLKNLFVADASSLGEITSSLGWMPELIVAGELLEHVDTPGALLRQIVHHMPLDSRILLTVPNAFSIKSILHMMWGHEKVHADHVAYYSFTTMLQLLSRCGLQLVDMKCYMTKPENLIERALDLFISPILAFRPFLSDGLIFCCRPLPPS